MLANFLEKNERARLGKSNWKGNGAFPKRSSQNKRLPPFMSRCVIQSSPTVISPRERSSVNTNLSQAEPGAISRAVTSHRSVTNAARSRGDLPILGASLANSSRGYRTTTQGREPGSAYRCHAGQTTCVECGRRSARPHAYVHPTGLTRQLFFLSRYGACR